MLCSSWYKQKKERTSDAGMITLVRLSVRFACVVGSAGSQENRRGGLNRLVSISCDFESDLGVEGEASLSTGP